jgi:hypothetical protein
MFLVKLRDVRPQRATPTEAVTGGLKMRVLLLAAVLAVLALILRAAPAAPKANDPEDVLFPLPPREVAAGMFEKWQQEAAKKPGPITYTRVEYDRKAFWVADAHFGYGNAYKRIAVYVPRKDGSFRRCLLADLSGAVHLAVAVDAKTGMLELREQASSSVKGEVVLSCNLKVAGTGLAP